MKKINELIDAVKLLQEYNKDHHERIHELEKLARIAESSLAQKSEQIKELQSYTTNIMIY